MGTIKVEEVLPFAELGDEIDIVLVGDVPPVFSSV
jgi:hypothetical protein